MLRDIRMMLSFVASSPDICLPLLLARPAEEKCDAGISTFSIANFSRNFRKCTEPHAGPETDGRCRRSAAPACTTDRLHGDISGSSYWKDEGPPFTLGHEIAGWVEKIGSGVTNFQHGDAVAINPSWESCGRCHTCQ